MIEGIGRIRDFEPITEIDMKDIRYVVNNQIHEWLVCLLKDASFMRAYLSLQIIDDYHSTRHYFAKDQNVFIVLNNRKGAVTIATRPSFVKS